MRFKKFLKNWLKTGLQNALDIEESHKQRLEYKTVMEHRKDMILKYLDGYTDDMLHVDGYPFILYRVYVGYYILALDYKGKVFESTIEPDCFYDENMISLILEELMERMDKHDTNNRWVRCDYE